MPLHPITHDCECGLSLDRDLNATRDILILGQGLSEVKPVETKALAVGNGSETVAREPGNVLKTTTGLKDPL